MTNWFRKKVINVIMFLSKEVRVATMLHDMNMNCAMQFSISPWRQYMTSTLILCLALCARQLDAEILGAWCVFLREAALWGKKFTVGQGTRAVELNRLNSLVSTSCNTNYRTIRFGQMLLPLLLRLCVYLNVLPEAESGWKYEVSKAY